MKRTLQLEQAGLFTGGLYLCYLQPVQMPWYAWLLLFFSPDISMIGYMAGSKTGAFSYNLFHHQGLASICLVFGFAMHLPLVMLCGALLLAHSAFDRVMGYGLKYEQGFKHTHLGAIGKDK